MKEEIQNNTSPLRTSDLTLLRTLWTKQLAPVPEERDIPVEEESTEHKD